jgi:hypothetical protein
LLLDIGLGLVDVVKHPTGTVVVDYAIDMCCPMTFGILVGLDVA